MKKKKKVLMLIAVLISGTVFLISCSPQTSIHELALEEPENFSESGEAEMPDQWWTEFNDNQLNSLMDSVIDSNFSLHIAWYRLQEAQAVEARENASFFPFLDAFFQAETNHPAMQFQDQQNYRLGLSASYEIDLWGRIGSRAQAASIRAEAARFDYRAAALSISAEIARTWYQLIEANNQVELTAEQVEINETVLELLENRFGSGQIRAVDILRQQQLLEATRTQKIYMETRVKTLGHQLAVLTSHPPQNIDFIVTDSLPALPPLPRTGIPSSLINRRPDVLSAFKQLQAADRDMAVAISNQYPRITLSASYSTVAQKPSRLFNDWFFTLAGNILAPVFYGGQLKAEVDRTQAIKKQYFYEYGQIVLNAFKEVEDALIQEENQKEAIEIIEEQLVLSRKTFKQLRIEYFNGLSDYLDVLTALEQEQQLRRDLLSARLQLIEYRISLYRALAGGFEPEIKDLEQ